MFPGIGGGIAIGGWVYLTGAYFVGADNFPIVGQFSSSSAPAFINDQASKAFERMNGHQADHATWTSGLAFSFGAAVTILLTIVRQFFAGFWFHPLALSWVRRE